MHLKIYLIGTIFHMIIQKEGWALLCTPVSHPQNWVVFFFFLLLFGNLEEKKKNNKI